MTMGGNDIAAWAKDKLSAADAMVAADQAADRLRAAVDWLKTPGRFPNGVFVVFANVTSTPTRPETSRAAPRRAPHS